MTGNKIQRSFEFVKDYSSQIDIQVSARLASMKCLGERHKPAEWEDGHVTCVSFTAP